MNHQHLLDVKALIAFTLFNVISFTHVEMGMKIIVFILTAGYQIHRWIRLKNQNRNEPE